MVQPFPEAGVVFEGRYRVESIIGTGGFAKIYLATQLDLGREVALKVMRAAAHTPGGTTDAEPAIAKRFEREAQLVSRLRDPHTITMHDFGQTGDGLLYMVFEYVDGQTISELLRSEGPVAPDRAMAILRQCLYSLQEAHSLGVLHRDIKPGNIMVFEHVGRRDQVKVLDFGIAKTVLNEGEKTADELTRSGSIVGTPRYMAPEQLAGHPLSPSTDLYSLGLVIYELLVGEKAIRADSMVTIITEQVSNCSVRLPAELDVPLGVRTLVERMIQKSPSRRFDSTEAVLAALDALDPATLSAEPAPRRPVAVEPAPRVPPPAWATEETPTVEARQGAESIDTETVEQDESASRRWWLVAVAAIAIGVGVGTLLALGDEPEPARVADASAAPAAHAERAATLKIDTSPSGAAVSVDEVYMGQSPVEVPLDALEFPVVVSADMRGRQPATRHLEAPAEAVRLELAEAPPPPAAGSAAKAKPDVATAPTAEPEPTTAEARTRPTTRPKPKPRPRPKPTTRPRPEPKAPADGSGESSFPALDL